jgi:hypothetical protein
MADYLAIARRALGADAKPIEAEPTAQPDAIAAAQPRVQPESIERRDEWGFPVGANDLEIDLATVTPCPRCNSLEKWWPSVGAPRCHNCVPPTAAARLLDQIDGIRSRQGIKAALSRRESDRPHCRRCFSTQFVDTKVHGGRSIRRDCAQCGLTAGFPMWWGRVDDRFRAT